MGSFTCTQPRFGKESPIIQGRLRETFQLRKIYFRERIIRRYGHTRTFSRDYRTYTVQRNGKTSGEKRFFIKSTSKSKSWGPYEVTTFSSAKSRSQDEEGAWRLHASVGYSTVHLKRYRFRRREKKGFHTTARKKALPSQL